MKTLVNIVFTFFLLIFTCGFNPAIRNTRWVINSFCSLKVSGTTNVNKFTCTILNYSNPDTLNLCTGNPDAPVRITGAVALDVQNFDCRNPVMTKDLRKTLRATDYPKLVIRFINLSKYPDFDEKQESINGVVNITLAGVTKQYDVDYKVISDRNRSVILIGKQTVNFSDFNLNPPKKMGGMIKTNNSLNVEFSLKLKVI